MSNKGAFEYFTNSRSIAVPQTFTKGTLRHLRAPFPLINLTVMDLHFGLLPFSTVTNQNGLLRSPTPVDVSLASRAHSLLMMLLQSMQYGTFTGTPVSNSCRSRKRYEVRVIHRFRFTRMVVNWLLPFGLELWSSGFDNCDCFPYFQPLTTQYDAIRKMSPNW